MNIRTACFIIGNGNRRRGHDLISAIAVRIIQARKERKAVESEAPGRDVDEALDVIASSLRCLGEEYDAQTP